MLSLRGLTPEQILARLAAMTPAEKADLDDLLFGPSSRPGFPGWLEEVSPKDSWHWPHLVYVQEQLGRLTRGEIDRLSRFRFLCSVSSSISHPHTECCAWSSSCRPSHSSA